MLFKTFPLALFLVTVLSIACSAAAEEHAEKPSQRSQGIETITGTISSIRSEVLPYSVTVRLRLANFPGREFMATSAGGQDIINKLVLAREGNEIILEVSWPDQIRSLTLPALKPEGQPTITIPCRGSFC